jgi:hypothetical protein
MPEFDNSSIHTLVGGAAFEPEFPAPELIADPADVPDNVLVFPADPPRVREDVAEARAAALDRTPAPAHDTTTQILDGPKVTELVAAARLDARGGI